MGRSTPSPGRMLLSYTPFAKRSTTTWKVLSVLCVCAVSLFNVTRDWTGLEYAGPRIDESSGRDARMKNHADNLVKELTGKQRASPGF